MILVVTGSKSILPNTALNLVLSGVVNITRSVPFIILMVAIIPLTRLLVGSSIGTTAAIVPLTMAAIPFVARVTEAAVSEVEQGCIEAALAMGASRLQVVIKALLSEGLPGLVRGLTITAVNLTRYSAMAGVLGGGGLGNLAIRYGYQRRETAILVATIFALVVLVQVIQAIGNRLAEALSK
jgi:D-methionine transport system permease protein